MTGIAQRLEADWDHLTARLRHQAQPSASSQQEEQPMTTPQQPQRLVDSLHDITGVIRDNYLVGRLLESRLGTRLTQSQAALVIAQVTEYEKQNTAIDQAHAQLAAQQGTDGGQVPQFTPHDDSAQFPADGQHQQ